LPSPDTVAEPPVTFVTPSRAPDAANHLMTTFSSRTPWALRPEHVWPERPCRGGPG
jgi:hypothetical protein